MEEFWRLLVDTDTDSVAGRAVTGAAVVAAAASSRRCWNHWSRAAGDACGRCSARKLVRYGLAAVVLIALAIVSATRRSQDGELYVPFSKGLVAEAPHMDAGDHLDESGERTLYHHYGLAHEPLSGGDDGSRTRQSVRLLIVPTGPGGGPAGEQDLRERAVHAPPPPAARGAPPNSGTPGRLPGS